MVYGLIILWAFLIFGVITRQYSVFNPATLIFLILIISVLILQANEWEIWYYIKRMINNQNSNQFQKSNISSASYSYQNTNALKQLDPHKNNFFLGKGKSISTSNDLLKAQTEYLNNQNNNNNDQNQQFYQQQQQNFQQQQQYQQQQNHFQQQQQSVNQNNQNTLEQINEEVESLNGIQLNNQKSSKIINQDRSLSLKSFRRSQAQKNGQQNDRIVEEQHNQQYQDRRSLQYNFQRAKSPEQQNMMPQVSKKTSFNNPSMMGYGNSQIHTAYSRLHAASSEDVSQTKHVLKNEGSIKQWYAQETNAYKTYLKDELKLSAGRIQDYETYLEKEVVQMRNKILNKIYCDQRDNLANINKVLSKYNIQLSEYKCLMKTIMQQSEQQYGVIGYCGDDFYGNQSDINSFNTNNTSVFNLDDILNDQTYLIDYIQQCVNNSTNTFQNNHQRFSSYEQDINQFQQDLRELLEERKYKLDETIQTRDQFDCRNLSTVRLYVITRLGLIIRNPSCQSFQQSSTINYKNVNPSDNEILVGILIKYFNSKLQYILNISKRKTDELSYKKRQQSYKYNAQREEEINHQRKQHFEKIIISLKIEYDEKFSNYSNSKKVIKDPKNNDAKKDGVQNDSDNDSDMGYHNQDQKLFDNIYFVKKNPVGCDFLADLYSCGEKYKTRPDQHNVDSCLYNYAKCVLDKIEKIEPEYQQEINLLFQISEFNQFIDQLKEIVYKLREAAHNSYNQNNFYSKHGYQNQYQNRGQSMVDNNYVRNRVSFA